MGRDFEVEQGDEVITVKFSNAKTGDILEKFKGSQTYFCKKLACPEGMYYLFRRGAEKNGILAVVHPEKDKTLISFPGSKKNRMAARAIEKLKTGMEAIELLVLALAGAKALKEQEEPAKKPPPQIQEGMLKAAKCHGLSSTRSFSSALHIDDLRKASDGSNYEIRRTRAGSYAVYFKKIPVCSILTDRRGKCMHVSYTKQEQAHLIEEFGRWIAANVPSSAAEEKTNPPELSELLDKDTIGRLRRIGRGDYVKTTGSLIIYVDRKIPHQTLQNAAGTGAPDKGRPNRHLFYAGEGGSPALAATYIDANRMTLQFFNVAKNAEFIKKFAASPMKS